MEVLESPLSPQGAALEIHWVAIVSGNPDFPYLCYRAVQASNGKMIMELVYGFWCNIVWNSSACPLKYQLVQNSFAECPGFENYFFFFLTESGISWFAARGWRRGRWAEGERRDRPPRKLLQISWNRYAEDLSLWSLTPVSIIEACQLEFSPFLAHSSLFLLHYCRGLFTSVEW